MFNERQQRLLRAAAEAGLDGLALNAGPSLNYFTGLHFHLMERPVVFFLVVGRTPLLVLPELEKAKLDQAGFALDALTYPEDPARWPETFGRASAELGLTGCRLGVEPGQLRLLEYRLLQGGEKTIQFEDGSAAIARLRAIKDDAEIELMARAVAIAQDSLAAVLPLLRIGMSEREVASELLLQLHRHGSDQPLPFAPIVSAGANGANPHARPSDRRLTPGDLLVIDWGASWQGYAADLTRTFAIGAPDRESEHIHALVRAANLAGRAAARPGSPGREVDRAARMVIEEAGYGQFFSHRTGHGIGLECHEEPYIHEGNREQLRVGMTFTVEPGIYLHGKNGVRIEDDVVITADGCRSLSDFPRELRIIGG